MNKYASEWRMQLRIQKEVVETICSTIGQARVHSPCLYIFDTFMINCHMPCIFIWPHILYQCSHVPLCPVFIITEEFSKYDDSFTGTSFQIGLLLPMSRIVSSLSLMVSIPGVRNSHPLELLHLIHFVGVFFSVGFNDTVGNMGSGCCWTASSGLFVFMGSSSFWLSLYHWVNIFAPGLSLHMWIFWSRKGYRKCYKKCKSY